VVLDVYKYAILLRCLEEGLMVCEGLDGGFGYQDVDLALDGVQSDGVMCCVGCEDCDCVAGGEGIDCGFVRVGIFRIIRRVGFEGGIESIVDIRDILVQMFACDLLSVPIDCGGKGRAYGLLGISVQMFPP
jgi:hypothetical protein